MKYKLKFNYKEGESHIYDADEYIFQDGGVFIQKRESFSGPILRAGNRLLTVKFVSMDGVDTVDILQEE